MSGAGVHCHQEEGINSRGKGLLQGRQAQQKSIHHLERWSSMVKEVMYSLDTAFRNKPGRKKQTNSAGSKQHRATGTWKKAQAPGLALSRTSPSELCHHHTCACLTTRSLGVFFFSLFRKRQPEFSPTSQCPSAHVQL